MRKVVDITGKVFGRLTVLGLERKGKGRTYWNCRCECGKEKVILKSNLMSGASGSCGCRIIEAKKREATHGLSKTRLANCWYSIKGRCLNKDDQAYHYYGGRGIKMYKEWEESLVSFYNWAMENGYEENLTIDRIDPNGNYEPSNCRWITQKEQTRNRRNNVFVEINGESKTIGEWAEISGIHASVLHARRKSKNFNEETFLRPQNKTFVEYNGHTYKVKEFSSLTGIKDSKIRSLLYKGKTAEEIIQISNAEQDN